MSKQESTMPCAVFAPITLFTIQQAVNTVQAYKIKAHRQVPVKDAWF